MPCFNKQYLMTAGPTPLPPAVSQVMAEPILYHRAPAFIEIYARVLERLSASSRPSSEVLAFAASGTRRDGVRGREPGRAGRRRGGRVVRQVRRALGRAVRRLRRRDRPPRDRVGRAGSTRPRRRGAGRAPAARRKALFTTQSETSTGVVNDVRALTEVAHAHGAVIARRRRLGSRRGRPADRRVGRRRGRVRLAEGADVPARPGLRGGLASARWRSRPRRRGRGARATTSTGARPARASSRIRPTARSPRP